MTAPTNAPSQPWTSTPTGNTGPQAPVPAGTVYISVKQYRARRGNCAVLTVDRQIKNDPDFPKPVYFGRLRYFKLSEIEAYERLCEIRAAEKAAAKAASAN